MQMDRKDRGIITMKRLLYFCSFIPYQLLEKNGFQMISAYSYISEKKGQTLLSGNPCSYIKACESIDFLDFDGVIFTNCCNSMQRLYDYIKYHYPELFVMILQVPRRSDESWDYNNLVNKLEDYVHCHINKESQYNLEDKKVRGDILVISSSLSQDYVSKLEELYEEYTMSFYTCWSEPRGDSFNSTKESVFCVRMIDYKDQIEQVIKHTKAVIFISMERCDFIMFSYPIVKQLCQKYKTRLLHMEEEYTSDISENSKLRYEAFKEYMELR